MRDPEVKCGCLPFPLYPDEADEPVRLDVQSEVFDEIYQQLWDYLLAAYQNRDDRWQALRIIIQAEKLIAEYTRQGFYLLNPLAEVLNLLFRAERRIFIRRAVLCREAERPIYKEALKRFEGPDALADFDAVQRHLDEGGPLFDDLRKWGAKLS